MPKKVRNEEVARHLIKNACAVKLKKLKKYEHQFLTLKGKCYGIMAATIRILSVTKVFPKIQEPMFTVKIDLQSCSK